MDIYEKINYISEKALPFLKVEWDLWRIENTEDLFEVIDWYSSLDDYMKDNFKTGLLSYQNYIDNVIMPSEIEPAANQLVVAIANGFVNRGSAVKQDKAEVVYNLYKSRPNFREATIRYALYAPKLVSNLIAYSCFASDIQAVKDIYENCISKFMINESKFFPLLDKIREEFTYNRSFSEYVTEENAYEHWCVVQFLDDNITELNLSETNYGDIVNKIKYGLDIISEIKPLKAKTEELCYWTDVALLPDFIEFNYIYPNGSNGDMIKFILEEYGETEPIDALLWRGRISKKYIDLFEAFSRVAEFISTDDNFLKIFECHIETQIRYKFYDMNSHYIKNYRGFIEIEQFLEKYKIEQERKRTDLYAQLILQGKASPKWKSEAQLFSLVSSIYPDAIYQYKAKWLGAQSLDIYIPSILVGIEYQGIQHYQPVEHFGGQRHFERQQSNDAKKRTLCLENNVKLIEWPYTDEISIDNLQEVLKQILNK